MAITLHGTPTTARQTATVTLTVTLPTAVGDGDFIAVFLVYNASPVRTVTAPSGWTVETTRTSVAAAANSTIFVWKIWHTGDPTTAVMTISGATATMVATCAAYSGVDPTNPIDDAKGLNYANSTTATCPSITVPSGHNADELLMNYGMGGSGHSATSPSLGTLEAQDSTTPEIALFDAALTASGATGDQTCLMGGSAGNILGIQVALFPTAAGVTSRAFRAIEPRKVLPPTRPPKRPISSFRLYITPAQLAAFRGSAHMHMRLRQRIYKPVKPFRDRLDLFRLFITPTQLAAFRGSAHMHMRLRYRLYPPVKPVRTRAERWRRYLPIGLTGSARRQKHPIQKKSQVPIKSARKTGDRHIGSVIAAAVVSMGIRQRHRLRSQPMPRALKRIRDNRKLATFLFALVRRQVHRKQPISPPPKKRIAQFRLFITPAQIAAFLMRLARMNLKHRIYQPIKPVRSREQTWRRYLPIGLSGSARRQKHPIQEKPFALRPRHRLAGRIAHNLFALRLRAIHRLRQAASSPTRKRLSPFRLFVTPSQIAAFLMRVAREHRHTIYPRIKAVRTGAARKIRIGVIPPIFSNARHLLERLRRVPPQRLRLYPRNSPLRFLPAGLTGLARRKHPQPLRPPSVIAKRRARRQHLIVLFARVVRTERGRRAAATLLSPRARRSRYRALQPPTTAVRAAHRIGRTRKPTASRYGQVWRWLRRHIRSFRIIPTGVPEILPAQLVATELLAATIVLETQPAQRLVTEIYPATLEQNMINVGDIKPVVFWVNPQPPAPTPTNPISLASATSATVRFKSPSGVDAAGLGPVTINSADPNIMNHYVGYTTSASDFILGPGSWEYQLHVTFADGTVRSSDVNGMTIGPSL